jgi:transcription antitermination protein NusB
MSNKQINTKSIARIAAIQALYQFENAQDKPSIDSVLIRIIDFYKDKNLKNDYELDESSSLKVKPSYNYLKELVHLAAENITEIDLEIKEHLIQGWQMQDLPVLLLALLRVAFTEIKYFPETPKKVIINEYTDIASDMLDENEIGFVNSLLDNYATKCK